MSFEIVSVSLRLQEIKRLHLLDLKLARHTYFRIGLHATPLTRALDRGDFAEAERLILEAGDPDYLNEGALDCTPLSLVRIPAQSSP